MRMPVLIRQLPNTVGGLIVALAFQWCIFAQAPPDLAEDSSRIAFGTETEFSSLYLWRGIVLYDRPVTQTSAWVSWSGLTAGAWGNFATSGVADSTRFQAASLFAGYERPWKGLRIEPGLEIYRWPEESGSSGTIEGSLGLSWRSGPLRLFTTHAFDIFAHKGAYFGEAGLGAERALTRTSWLSVSVRSGWASSSFNGTYIGRNVSALNFVGIDGAVTTHVKSYLYVRPSVQFSNVLDERIREELSSPRVVNVGLAIGVEF